MRPPSTSLPLCFLSSFWYPEEAVVLAGPGSQAAPGRYGGATQLGAHRQGSVPASMQTNQMTVPLNSANGSVFFRLVRPY